jgi:hypothetical protein
MTIKSMTGFARADGATGLLSWHWEVRSVNGRGLDVRLRVQPGFEALEPRIREAVARRISRGSLSVNLSARRAHGHTEIRLNEIALKQVLAAVETLKATVDVAPPSAEALLNVRGVLELVEPEEDEVEAAQRTEAMLASLDGGCRILWCGSSPTSSGSSAASSARLRARRLRCASASGSRWPSCSRPASHSTRRASIRRRLCSRPGPTWRRN